MSIRKKRIVRHQYTIVELLVVLVIAGLLTGMTMTGIKGALARQGAAGAVRTLSAKISLAQSFAVSRNRYVALLMPDYEVLDDDTSNLNGNTDGYSLSAYTTFTSHAYSFTKNRLCYVTKNTTDDPTVYEFDRWIEGYEWQTLPSKTIAFISEQGADSTPVEVRLVPDPTNYGNTNECTALIFKPSGALLNANSVIVRVFRAA
ncbi:MAG: hypothetical protein KAS17_08090, partial [Victivallaceae bacterium]|nr:hypothetical protein [Victivallaceae bacterium]